MKIETGNLLDKKRGIIIHQVNNRHVMGGGIALQIRDAYPQHYVDYMESSLVMGSVLITRIRDDLFIVGIVAQDGFGRGRRYTNYEAFEKCLSKLGEYTGDLPMYLPYNIGCGLGGGDWGVIEGIIERYLPKAIIVRL